MSTPGEDAPSTTLVGQLSGGVLALRAVDQPASGPDAGRGPGSLRQPGSRVARDRLARAPSPGRGADAGRADPGWGAAGRRRATDGRQLRGDVAVHRRAPGSRCCSSTASRGRGRTGSRTSPTSSKTHRVVALDLPGFGHSPMPAWRISIESYGRLLHRFCDALGVGDCAVVGNSMGGFISAEAASAEPGRFEKLVLVSAAGVSSRAAAAPAGRDGGADGGRRCSAAPDAPGARHAAATRPLGDLQGAVPAPRAAAPRAAARAVPQRRRPARLPARRPGPGRLRHPRPARPRSRCRR